MKLTHLAIHGALALSGLLAMLCLGGRSDKKI